MPNKYDQINIEVGKGDVIRFLGYYEYSVKGENVKKVMNLTYKVTLKTKSNLYSYLLPDNIRGLISKSVKADHAYKFWVQMGRNTMSSLIVYGITSSTPEDAVEKCELSLLHPIIIDRSPENGSGGTLELIFCGISSIHEVLNVVGRGVREVPPRKISKPKVKEMRKVGARSKR